jgi:hypothetical protein
LTLPDGSTVIAANPLGPVDREVVVWSFDGFDGRPVATVVNHACHPVVLGNDTNAISADWPGEMRRHVEEETAAPCIFLQGACGDVNPVPGVPTNDESDLVNIGTRVAQSALEARATAREIVVDNICASSRVVRLPFMDAPRYERERPKLVEMARLLDDLSLDQIENVMRVWHPWMPPIVLDRGQQFLEAEVQALRLGGAELVALSAEPFVLTGAALKALSKEPLVVCGYANGMVGYVPCREDFARGGYEVDEAHLFYRTPGPVSADAADLLVNSAAEQLTALRLCEGKEAERRGTH